MRRIRRYFPDEGTGLLGPTRHGRYDGDSRSAISPLLAYRQVQSMYCELRESFSDSLIIDPTEPFLNILLQEVW